MKMKNTRSIQISVMIIFVLFSVSPAIVSNNTIAYAHRDEQYLRSSIPPLGPPADQQMDIMPESLGKCAVDRCVGAAPSHSVSSSNATSTPKRTQGSNSQLAIPQNLVLADIDGDGISDFVQYSSNKVFVSKTNFEKTGILHHYQHRPIKRMITGDFHHDNYDQTCLITDDNAFVCFGTSPAHDELWWWFTQGSFVGDNEDTIVGDFDGDGRDDILVYSRSGGNIRLYSIKGDFIFESTPGWKAGNLDGALEAGLQLRAGDFNGDGRDDLLIVNHGGQAIRYDSAFDGTYNTFWWAFTSRGDIVKQDDQVTAARIDDNTTADVILRSRSTGATRFFQLEWADGDLPPITNVSSGQLNQDANSLLFWGAVHGNLGEPGATTREDAMVYNLDSNMFIRSDARWDGNNLTYWWAYSQLAPNNHTGWASFSAKPWLMLKCKVSDIANEPQNTQFYHDLNSAHIGYWWDQSYGSWDLSGSKLVDAWIQMSLSNAQWQSLNRYGKAGACIDAYAGSKSGYVNVISIVNGYGDAGNDGGRVLIDNPPSDPSFALNLSFLSHETGHTFGWWGHSFDDTNRKSADWSSPGEYFDSWDIMSARNVHEFMTGQGFVAGPGLNAPYRTFQSFIAPQRILRLSANDITQGVRLNIAALDRPEANGPLMVRIGSDDSNYFTIEYRIKRGWEQGIPQSTVLVHQVKNGTSYLITSGATERLPGSISQFAADGHKFTLTVHGFADVGYTADVTIDLSDPAAPTPTPTPLPTATPAPTPTPNPTRAVYLPIIRR